jgi:hypothetical protein
VNQQLTEDMMDKIKDVFLTLGQPIRKKGAKAKGAHSRALHPAIY